MRPTRKRRTVSQARNGGQRNVSRVCYDGGRRRAGVTSTYASTGIFLDCYTPASPAIAGSPPPPSRLYINQCLALPPFLPLRTTAPPPARAFSSTAAAQHQQHLIPLCSSCSLLRLYGWWAYTTAAVVPADGATRRTNGATGVGGGRTTRWKTPMTRLPTKPVCDRRACSPCRMRLRLNSRHPVHQLSLTILAACASRALLLCHRLSLVPLLIRSLRAPRRYHILGE